MAPIDHWPLFGLRVETPRVELRYPDDEVAAALAEIAVQGIHPPGFRPFLRLWDAVPPPHQQRNTHATPARSASNRTSAPASHPGPRPPPSAASGSSRGG